MASGGTRGLQGRAGLLFGRKPWRTKGRAWGTDMAPSNLLTAAVLALMLTTPALAQAPSAPAVHDSLLTLDTHLDTPANFARPGWDIIDRHKIANRSQVDYPRMVEGGLKGGFFAIYTPQGPRTPEGNRAARDAAIMRGIEIREMIAKHGDKFEQAFKADDAAAIMAKGKRFVFMSIENSYPIEGDLSLMSTFQAMGVRLIGPAHFKDNDLADSATDKPEWHGLGPLGKQFVAEANRLGLVLDASHSSDDVLDQMMALSKTPVILSHSGCKAIYDNPRNIDDAHLKALAADGGVIQINSLSAYLIPTPKNPDRDAAMAALTKKAEGGHLTSEQQAALGVQYAAIQAKYPEPKATFDDFMKHMLHALKVAGVDHVGIGADMDGGGGVVGMEDITGYPKITAALLKAGYTKDDVAKIWGGNVLRVLKQAEDYKASLAH
jgi:membrane dipeptidase